MNTRILGCRYPLNKSRSTWLEVGISVEPRPAVQIVLINRHNREVVISEDAWYELQQRKGSIMSYFSTDIDVQRPNETLDNTTLMFGRVNNNNSLCFTVTGREEEVIILRETCENLYRLHSAVLNVIEYLDTRLHIVEEKLKTFVNIARGLEIKTAQTVYEAILSSKFFDRLSIVDTEIVSLCLDFIVSKATQ